jgi:YhcH/YjgK/YiaL family protein
LDKIENWKSYSGLETGLARGLALLAAGKLDGLNDGRHEIAGNEIFASVQTYLPKTAAEGRWEAHRRYIDIQYLVYGSEGIGYSPLEKLKVTQAYDPEKDIMFFSQGPEAGSLLKVETKMFAIFFPADAHMPGLSLGEPAGQPAQVKKIVLKILAGEKAR